MMPRQADTKQLLKEGLYWEALGLPANSRWSEIDIPLAVLEQQHQRDQETLVLLAAAKRDLQSGYYPPARKLCDPISANMGEQFRRRIIEEDTLLREYLWQRHFMDRVSEFKTPQGINRVKSACVIFLRNNAIELANCAQEKFSIKTICCDITIQAVEKSKKGLETALIYSPEDSDMRQNLNLIRKSLAYLYRNRGVQRINRAQDEFNAKLKTLMSQMRGGNPKSPALSRKSLDDATMKEIRGGIKDIEQATELEKGEKDVEDQLKIAYEILKSFENQMKSQMRPGEGSGHAI